jgi:hypothetical protein
MDHLRRSSDETMFMSAADAKLGLEWEMKLIFSFHLSGSNCLRPKTSLLVIYP